MPNKIKKMDPEAMIAERDGIKLYMRDIIEDYPLYRKLKLVSQGPIYAQRRTAHVTWIVHLIRLQRGGDSWRLCQARPDLYDWITAECALSFGPDYVQDTFGLTPDEYQALVEAENKKYKK